MVFVQQGIARCHDERHDCPLHSPSYVRSRTQCPVEQKRKDRVASEVCELSNNEVKDLESFGGKRKAHSSQNTLEE
jgi:hypothetical protein